MNKGSKFALLRKKADFQNRLLKAGED